MGKVATTKIGGGADYALVPVRLKAFREANPRAKTETHPTIQDDTIIFKAHIVKDKADENSAEATGHAYGKNTGNKAFEKLETVALGRALAQLGYLNNGQIATSEEMEEFEEYQLNQVIEEINAASKRVEFQAILAKLKPSQRLEVTPIINKRIGELKNGNTDKS